MANLKQNEAALDSHESRLPVAVVGFGAAAFNAVVSMRTEGYQGGIRVFSNAGKRPYSPILTSYYAAGLKTREECFPWSDEEISELGINLVTEPVVELDPIAHIVRTQSGEYPYGKCIVASGSYPSHDGFPEDCGYKPLMLHTMDDAERLRAALLNPECKRLLVSGASMVGLKVAEAAIARGVDVTLVGRSAHALGAKALPEVAERFERGLVAQGVELRMGQAIKTVSVVSGEGHSAGRRLEVTFSTGEADFYDEICIAHGVKPNSGFVAEGALETGSGLIVDDFMRTSDADVYAAGDVAQALERVSGEKRVVAAWKSAALQGACAGRVVAAELAGTPVDAGFAFEGDISANTIAVRDVLFISAGSIEPAENRRVEVRETEDMTVACVLERGVHGTERLVGFNLACDHNEEGGLAYDTGAMLALRIEQGLNKG